MQNPAGKAECVLSLEVADRKQIPPTDWNVALCQAWLKEELEMEEDNLAHFAGMDGAQLVTLRSKEDVAAQFPASKFPQKVLASQVRSLVEEWAQGPSERGKAKADAPQGASVIEELLLAASASIGKVFQSGASGADQTDAPKVRTYLSESVYV